MTACMRFELENWFDLWFESDWFKSTQVSQEYSALTDGRLCGSDINITKSFANQLLHMYYNRPSISVLSNVILLSIGSIQWRVHTASSESLHPCLHTSSQSSNRGSAVTSHSSLPLQTSQVLPGFPVDKEKYSRRFWCLSGLKTPFVVHSGVP